MEMKAAGESVSCKHADSSYKMLSEGCSGADPAPQHSGVKLE